MCLILFLIWDTCAELRDKAITQETARAEFLCEPEFNYHISTSQLDKTRTGRGGGWDGAPDDDPGFGAPRRWFGSRPAAGPGSHIQIKRFTHRYTSSSLLVYFSDRWIYLEP